MRNFRNLIAALLFAVPVIAFAASTINPTVPASNSAISSAPIRNNFQASYNDINGIESKFNSASSPYQPNAYQEWVDTTSATAPVYKVYVGGQWVTLGTWNCSGSPCTWSGGGLTLPLSGANGGTGVANTSKTITLGASLTTTGAGAPTLAFPGSSFTYTFQGSSDTIVGRATTDTLTNKTITSGIFGTAATFNWITGSTQCLQVNTSGVLSGTGGGCGSSSVPTYETLTTSGTYTTLAGARELFIRCVGGGGGGGTGVSGTQSGSAGGTTTFNSINAAGGSGGGGTNATQSNAGGAGGAGGTGTASFRSRGMPGGATYVGTGGDAGAAGGSSLLGGGAVSVNSGNGTAADANTGGGGAGGAGGTASGGAGGGGGEYFEYTITSPGVSYSYTIGAGGAGGTGGTTNGGAGGSGVCRVTTFY